MCLGYFCKIISYQDFSKFTQSGHTVKVSKYFLFNLICTVWDYGRRRPFWPLGKESDSDSLCC